MFPCSSLYMWRGYVATTLSPAVSIGNIVDSINFAVSFLQINSHADTSNSTKLDRYRCPKLESGIAVVTSNHNLDAENVGWVYILTHQMTL